MSIGAGDYLVIVGGQLCRYTHIDQIPGDFDHIVKFLPDIPPGPHTHEQHEDIERLGETFRAFMEKEYARRHASR